MRFFTCFLHYKKFNPQSYPQKMWVTWLLLYVLTGYLALPRNTLKFLQ